MPSYNNIEAITLFQNACDQQMIEGATSGWMEANAARYKYTGGRDIKIPTISTDGLGNYDRGEGFPKGKVSLTYQTQTMSMDRGVEFLLDRIEVDESGFIAAASATMSVFQSENVIPEVDAYRYSKLFSLAHKAGKSREYTPASGTIYTTLKSDITSILDTCGGNMDLVIVMPFTVADIFDSSDKLSRYLNVGDFTQGNVTTKVKTIDGIPIIRVPSARMKTEYIFKDGSETNGFGFAPAANARQINWIVCARSAPVAVSKTDGVKIFEPKDVQGADGWLVDYRKFHDLWVDANKLKAVRVCAAPAPAPANTETTDTGTEGDGE